MAPKGKEQPKAKKPTTAADKTFGMKNKKGGAAKRVITQLEASTKAGGTPEEKRKQAEKAAREKEKAASEAARKEAAELFKPLQSQKVPFGVDPKTVLCQFFKAGDCDKGRRCKFSHDLEAARRVEKKNLYEDTRDKDRTAEREAREKDDMADWDEDKLRKVVLSKQGNPKTTTDKVCKFFIEAVENGKYGWFWTCPNGGDQCMYKHSLPPGFKLKTKEQRAAERAMQDKSALAQLTLEDWLDSERHKLSGTLTPVTPESFAKWKKERLDKKAGEQEALAKKEATGRAMFEKEGFEGSDYDSDDENVGAFNLAALRRETEMARQRKEEDRLAALAGVAPNYGTGSGTGMEDANGNEDENEADE